VEPQKAEIAAQRGGENLGARGLEASAPFRQIRYDALRRQPGNVDVAVGKKLVKELANVSPPIKAGSLLQSNGVDQEVVKAPDFESDTIQFPRLGWRHVSRASQDLSEVADACSNGIMLTYTAERAVTSGEMAQETVAVILFEF
jgi:hypothetical protein